MAERRAGPTLADTPKLNSTRRRSVKLCVLISEAPSCKYACKFMRAFFVNGLDEVHMVTAVNTEDGRHAALSRQKELVDTDIHQHVQHHVVQKEEDYNLYESLGRYIAANIKPHLIFMASTNLCTNYTPPASSGARPSAARPNTAQQPGGPPLGGPSRGPGGGGGGGSGVPLGLLGSSVAVRVLAELRCAPVMLVKYNSKGSWPLLGSVSIGGATTTVMAAGAFAAAVGQARPEGVEAFLRSNSFIPNSAAAAAPPSMKVMVDLHANSRHVLDWLFEHFTAGRDTLMLTVTQAYDERSNVKPAAQRLLTAFGVQAAVNAFDADKAMLAGPPNKSLPQAVAEAEPDVLVVQLPRCKGVPQNVTELLHTAKTSFLLWPPEYDPASPRR